MARSFDVDRHVRRERARDTMHAAVHNQARSGKRGRPKEPLSRQRHGKRAPVLAHEPQLVTNRVRPDVPNLRNEDVLRILWDILADVREHCAGMRVCHWVMMANHFHFVVEADDNEALAKGMQGLKVRIAKRLNSHFRRSGEFWHGRFHNVALTSPWEVANVIGYVLFNAKKHGVPLEGDLDPYSSAGEFDWEGELELPPTPPRPTVSEPRTQLLSGGYRRASGWRERIRRVRQQ